MMLGFLQRWGCMGLSSDAALAVSSGPSPNAGGGDIAGGHLFHFEP